ncbi:antitoxin VapB family protein [Candidatus Woesearchaeota archaeon]|nr:antitoxin VapB family protein [Candidatus Woesearchaeota archaeon]
MATKNIAITEDAYELLARHKRPNESFSGVIKEHFRKGKKLTDYAGIWADMPDNEWKAIEKGVKDAREGINKGLAKRISSLKL